MFVDDCVEDSLLSLDGIFFLTGVRLENLVQTRRKGKLYVVRIESLLQG